MLGCRAALLRRRPAWRQARWLAAEAQGSSGAPEATWVLVQHDGGSTTTAASGSGGGVELRQSYAAGGAGEPAPALSLNHLRQAMAAQLQATFLPSGEQRRGGACWLSWWLRYVTRRRRHMRMSLSRPPAAPVGYPHTVAPRYLCNTMWQAAHHTCGSINGGEGRPGEGRAAAPCHACPCRV